MTKGKVYLSISAYFALQKVQNHPLEPPTVLHNDKHKGHKGKVTALSQSQSHSLKVTVKGSQCGYNSENHAVHPQY